MIKRVIILLGLAACVTGCAYCDPNSELRTVPTTNNPRVIPGNGAPAGFPVG